MSSREYISTLRPTPPALLAAALALSGCAVNPLVSWDRPGGGSSPVSLEFAQGYADKARAEYAKARYAHVQMTTGLNSSLLGLGVLGTGFALAKLHRDALLGTAFVGGTAYAFGQQNLNVQHRLIYEAGIDAIGCVKEAVQPLAISAEDRKALTTGMAGLETAIGSASAARATAVSALAGWNATNPARPELGNAATAAISAAGVAVDAATTSVTSGRLLIRRAGEAGDKLVASVERIDAAVNKNVTATLPDPASVFKVIAGLPGFAAGIVPGSDAAFNAAVARSSAALKAANAAPSGAGAPAPQSGSEGAPPASPPLPPEQRKLLDALEHLNLTNDKLKLALATVNGYLPTDESLRGFQTLKECGLGELSLALNARPAAPSITAGADRKTSFTISGGTPPYVVQLQVSPMKGVNLITPAPFDSTVIFEITKDADAGSVPVVVMDASKPPRAITVPVEILPAAKIGGGGGDTPATQSAGASDGLALAKKIGDTGVFKPRADLELSVVKVAFNNSTAKVDLSLRCKPKPAACLNPDAARIAVLAGVSEKASHATTLNIAPATDCICAK